MEELNQSFIEIEKQLIESFSLKLKRKKHSDVIINEKEDENILNLKKKSFFSDGFFKLFDKKKKDFLIKNISENEKKLKNIFDKDRFIKVDYKDIENTEEELTEKNWNKILNDKKKILFEQNCFIIKNNLIKKGSPNNLKLKIWNYLSDVKNLKKTYKNISYNKILEKKASYKDYQQILKDVRRTYSNNYNLENYKIQFLDSIKNILIAYSIFNPEVGYIQGMNIIVASLLYNLSKKEIEIEKKKVFFRKKKKKKNSKK